MMFVVEEEEVALPETPSLGWSMSPQQQHAQQRVKNQVYLYGMGSKKSMKTP